MQVAHTPMPDDYRDRKVRRTACVLMVYCKTLGNCHPCIALSLMNAASVDYMYDYELQIKLLFCEILNEWDADF